MKLIKRRLINGRILLKTIKKFINAWKKSLNKHYIYKLEQLLLTLIKNQTYNRNYNLQYQKLKLLA